MKKDQSSKKITQSVSEKKDEREPVDPRNALFAAIKARGAQENLQEEKQSVDSDPRKALFAAIKKRGEAETPKDSDCDFSDVTKLSPGVQKLHRFLSHAEVLLSFAERDQNAAIRACKVRLSLYKLSVADLNFNFLI